MIEVVFGEGEAGALKFALRGGKLGDGVIALPFALDIGDIKKPVTGKYRAELLYKLLYREQYGEDPQMRRELKNLGKVYAAQYEKLLSLTAAGEELRVWYSSAPYSMCGFLWLCSLCGDARLYAMRLPAFVDCSDKIISYSSWGEVAPNRFERFLPRQRLLSEREKSVYAGYWSELQGQNAPLRIVLNGSVIGAPANFYDFLILRSIGGKPIKQAAAIGKMLCENRIGISDWLVAERIEKLISQNRVAVIEDSPKKYERIIVKA